jgi:heat shock protein HslJ
MEGVSAPYEDFRTNSQSIVRTAELQKPKPYFEGHGLDPRWKIEIFSDSIFFTSEVTGYELIKVAHQEPEKDSKSKFYNCLLPGGQLQIEITSESCTIEGSNESFIYSLFVSLHSKADTSPVEFEGCGHYITDVMLTGRWILEQIRDAPVDKIAFKDNVPTLEIEPKRNSFSGFAGCNKINGRIFSEQCLLRFTDVVSTRMSCDHIDLENEFLESLGFSTQFIVEDDRLKLSNPMNTTLVFRKEQ